MLLALSACAARPPVAASTTAHQVGLLARSTPADGASVTAPVDQLQLHFARPARLLEVTVDGPDGTSPMMISAAGETTDYSVPLPGLAAGAYRINWKATAAGRAYDGMISINVSG